jgi:cell wall-associated NlpC family hydrolase
LRVTNGLIAIGLATIIALGGSVAAAAPVTATDPSPAPTDAPAPTVEPSPTADPSPEPSATPDPSVSPDPAPSVTPDPSATVAPTTSAVVAPKPVDRGLLVKKIALRQRWDRYVAGAAGPNAFDCSGLVRYVYSKAGVGRKIGGGRSARAMLTWGRMKGITSRRNPQIGDVAIWGNGRHAGIYIGRGYVISALNPRQDIRITRLHALGDPFTTFIHTGI